MMIGFVLVYIIVAERLTNRFKLTPANRIVGTLVFWSKNITNIYLVSW